MKDNMEVYKQFYLLDQNKDLKLSKLELNEEEPMTEITPILKKFDLNNDKELGFSEYIKHYNDVEHSKAKCTVKEEDNHNNKDLTKCSTATECYNPNTREPDNNFCIPTETCATIALVGQQTKAHRCILSKYCYV